MSIFTLDCPSIVSESPFLPSFVNRFVSPVAIVEGCLCSAELRVSFVCCINSLFFVKGLDDFCHHLILLCLHLDQHHHSHRHQYYWLSLRHIAISSISASSAPDLLLLLLTHNLKPDNFPSISTPCLRRQPLRLALLRPCLPAAMRYKTTTPTKAHLGLCHTLHHPSHPTLASGLVYHKYGSIDGPFSSYLFLLVPLLPSPASTTIWVQHGVRLSPHAQTLNRWALPWHPCHITCPRA